jgi:hypothetical protein
MFTFLTEIFCYIDDFCNSFDKTCQNYFLTGSRTKRKKPCRISLSEIMTIMILFHRSEYRNFKYFYLCVIMRDLKKDFPNALSYQRFVYIMEYALMPLVIFLSGLKGRETGLYYVDSTSIEVCHIKREKSHKVFKGLATKGKNSMGWFFGFKLHLVINNFGEIMSCSLSKANVDDRKPVPKLVESLKGWLFGDKGYLGQAFMEKLKEQSIELFTKVKKNIAKKEMSTSQKFFLSKRGLVETVIDQLKNICQIEHSRHRKPANAFVNLIAGLIAYCFKPRKPSINLGQLGVMGTALTQN